MKAVIYARFSSEKQREESIDGQIRECREYAARNGITIIGTYIDRALSASKDTDKRIDFQKMVKDSAKRSFDLVLVWKLDRFARSRYDSAYYKSILKKNGVKVVSVTEPISNTAEGIILESLLEGMAEYYSAELSEKIHRGLKENALKGINNGGVTPLGYRIGADQRLEVDEATAPIVREIFQRYTDGEMIKAIIQDLTERGITNSKGNPFTKSSFNTLITNRKYIGEYKYMDIVHPDAIPPIISADLFERAQRRKEKNRHTPASQKAVIPFLLTTKLYCGECERMMLGESGTSKTGNIYYYYKCAGAKKKLGCKKKAVKKDWIEDIVINQTMQMIMKTDILTRLVDKLYELQNEENSDLIYLKDKQKRIQTSIDNLVKAIEQGIITPTTKERLQELESERESVEIAIAKEELNDHRLTKEQIEYYIFSFQALDPTNNEHRKRIVDNFVSAVYLFDDRVVLTYNYKEGSETISLSELKSSNMDWNVPPYKRNDRVHPGHFFCAEGRHQGIRTPAGFT